MRGGSAATRLSRRGARSLDGSLIVRGLERAGAAITEPASEERESSWKVVGLMFRRDIWELFAGKQSLTPATQSDPNPLS